MPAIYDSQKPKVLIQETMEMLKSFKNNVSSYELFMQVLKSYFLQKCEVFQGGQIKEKFENWQKLTDDTEMLETVKGARFEFESV